ncbi:MAG TPA: branched-chain amino acid ABC transporter permease [Candidatus Saccharimonadales bacterium]|nr:branched-chain amino acid ABC transporter permease [Candidatus Saccharimonadales bacterium]
MQLVVGGVLNGLSFGFILFLVASGLTITLGLMRTLNLAQGAMYMIGGYIAWALAAHFPGGFWIGLLVSGVVVTGIGLLIDLLIFRQLANDLPGVILGTFGILIILTNVVDWVWNSEPKGPAVPEVLGGSVSILGVHYPVIRLSALAFAGSLALLLWFVQERTRLGSLVKAGVDDSEMAQALGINVALTGRVVFAIAAFVTGLSGAFGQALTGLTTDIGLTTLLLALIVTILGGLGSLEGALVGSIVLGLAQAFGTVWFPEYVAVVPYAIMIVVLAVRPTGLFGKLHTRTG